MRKEDIVYPDTIRKVMQEGELMKKLEAHISADAGAKAMLLMLQKPARGLAIRDLYAGKNRRHKVPLDHRLAASIAQIEEGENAENAQIWDQIGARMMANAERAFEKEILPKYYKSREFEAHHNEVANEQAAKKNKNARRLADEMGLKEGPVLEIMTALSRGMKTDAAKLTDKLIQKYKLTVHRDTILKALERGKAADELKDGRGRAKIRVTNERLKRCGFVNVTNARLKEAVEEMAEAAMAGNSIDIRNAYLKIRKIEPKPAGGPSDQVDSGNMIKDFKRAKIIE